MMILNDEVVKLHKYLKIKKYKKILIITGKNSYFKSGANIILKSIIKDKNVKFYLSPALKPKEYLYNWSNVYSGIYFINEMEPIYQMPFSDELKTYGQFKKRYEDWKLKFKVKYFDRF